MNEVEELIENLDFENNRYFYHVTGKGFGNEVIEEGLFMEDNELSSTTIELPIEMINDPVEYCESEYTNGNVKRQEMVIIGCENGEEGYIIENADIPKWVGDQKLEYIIPKEYILGYIDLENLDVIYNDEYQYGGRHV